MSNLDDLLKEIETDSFSREEEESEESRYFPVVVPGEHPSWLKSCYRATMWFEFDNDFSLSVCSNWSQHHFHCVEEEIHQCGFDVLVHDEFGIGEDAALHFGVCYGQPFQVDVMVMYSGGSMWEDPDVDYEFNFLQASYLPPEIVIERWREWLDRGRLDRGEGILQ